MLVIFVNCKRFISYQISMKKVTKFIFVLFSYVALLSCGGDVKIPSKISLKIGPGYTSTNIYASMKQEITVGIIASKLETSTILKTFQISTDFDETGTSTSYSVENLSAKDADNLSRDFKFKTRAIAGTEKWIFSVTNSDGITNQIYILLIVS
jgi:hypothetical protein